MEEDNFKKDNKGILIPMHHLLITPICITLCFQDVKREGNIHKSKKMINTQQPCPSVFALVTFIIYIHVLWLVCRIKPLKCLLWLQFPQGHAAQTGLFVYLLLAPHCNKTSGHNSVVSLSFCRGALSWNRSLENGWFSTAECNKCSHQHREIAKGTCDEPNQT